MPYGCLESPMNGNNLELSRLLRNVQYIDPWLCRDSGIHMQHHPNLNGISVGCIGPNLDESLLMVAWSLVDGQQIRGDCTPMNARWTAPECSWNIDLKVAQSLWMGVVWHGNSAYTWTCMAIPCHLWCYHWYKCVACHRNAMEALWNGCVWHPN